MRIGFDAKRLFLNNTGLGNYSRTLVRNLIKYFPDNEYYLYTPSIDNGIDTDFFQNSSAVKICLPEGSKAMWRSFGIKQQIINDQIDVFHGLSNELPIGISSGSIPTIVTIHDVIFKRYPKQYGFWDRKVYNFKTKLAILESDKVISISEQTQEDLINFYQLNIDKSALIYQSCNQRFIDFEEYVSLNNRDYFLYVGSVIERKNLLNIVKALKAIQEKDRKKLVIIGTGKKYFQKVKDYISKNELHNWIEWKGQISNEELLQWYSNAIALIYPSIFEGFGIPVIESLHCGTPVITSNLSSLKEAGGKASILIDPNDPAQITQAMYDVQNSEYKKIFSNKIKVHLNQFSPSEVSLKLMDLYKSIGK